MIGKIFPKCSGSFEGRINYIFGLSKHDHAISKITLIDSNSVTPNPLPAIQAGDKSVVEAMVEEFDSVVKMRGMTIDSDKKIKPVFHAMLSLRPGESLTHDQWQQAVRMYMSDLGFVESCKYVAVLHEDTDHQHVHIVANRIRLEDGFKMVKDSEERTKTVDSVSRMEDTFGMVKSPKPSETWGIEISHAEVTAASKTGDIPFKHKMIAKVAGTIEKTRSMDGDMFMFVRLLRRQGVHIQLTMNDNGQPKGIVYELDGKKISGRQLKRSRLTWQKLITQEGIDYDPETISDLETEIARRDEGDTEAVVVRYRYYIFTYGRRKLFIKFKSKEEDVAELIMTIIALLLALFGVKFQASLGKPASWYQEYKLNEEFKPQEEELSPA